jgi:uncharacterized protein (DUF983 family)
MRSYVDAIAQKEYMANNTPEKRVMRNSCPKCNGDLDTGYECTVCGFDAIDIANKLNKANSK